MLVALSEFMMVPCAPIPSCSPITGFGLWSITLSGFLFAISYLAILVMLVAIGWRRRDLALRPGYRILLLFVLTGAIAPVVSLYGFRTGNQLLVAVCLLGPALIATATALMLWRLLPGLLGQPSSIDLRRTNKALRQQMEKRRNAESALLQSQKMEALGRISGGLAHDFNNMLQVISGNARLIAHEYGENPEIAALADSIQASVERGVLLTGKLLSFSQEQSFMLEPVHIPDFVASLPARIASILPPRVTLEIEGGDIATSVLADVTQLELAILNTARNSHEAMPDGGLLRITFSSYRASGRRDLSDGDYLRIIVADTGLGMAPSIVDRAFDPFFSTKPVGLASGLGLSMVYAMAQRSGGTATIESRLGDGATVSIYLMLAPPVAASPGDATPVVSDSFVGRTVMVVDDEAATRAVVALTLESLDCDVIIAQNGVQALALTDEAWPDLFLLDYAMPTMTGVELAAELRARNPSCCFVFLTGFADFSEIRAVAGINVIILQKPVSRAKLADALRRAFASQA
jgi:signal transduction histidine kinase/CheY-like chemotaxis protein